MSCNILILQDIWLKKKRVIYVDVQHLSFWLMTNVAMNNTMDVIHTYNINA